MKLFKGKTFLVFLLTAIGLIAAFIALFLYVASVSMADRTFSWDSKKTATPPGEGSGVPYVTMSVPEEKRWLDFTNHTAAPVGAEYDFTMINEGTGMLEGWTLDMTFNENLLIDSFWNGTYEVNGNTIHFTPDKNADFMKHLEPATFGAVIYSQKDLELVGYTIKGRLPIKVLDLPVFYILIVLGLVWIVAFFSYIVSFARVSRLQKQRERDLLIISQSIMTFTNFIDAKDPYTKGHSVRVAQYSMEIAKRMGFSEDKVQDLYYEALLHDAGKIGIPDAILTKPGKLTNEEYEIIKTHTTIGSEILSNFTTIPEIKDGAHYHHERYDGKGYPSGLKGEEIPLNARIICVADSYDAMSSHRSYRKPYDKEKILEELRDNAMTQFDPEIVPIMISMIEDGFTEKIRAEFGAEADYFGAPAT